MANGRKRVDKQTARIIKRKIDEMVKEHGLDAVRRTFNAYAQALRLKSKLMREKGALERELEEVNQRLGG